MPSTVPSSDFEDAKADEARHLAAVAPAKPTDDADPIRAAERALSEAQAQLDRARKTRDALTAEANDATQSSTEPGKKSTMPSAK